MTVGDAGFGRLVPLSGLAVVEAVRLGNNVGSERQAGTRSAHSWFSIFDELWQSGDCRGGRRGEGWESRSVGNDEIIDRSGVEKVAISGFNQAL